MKTFYERPNVIEHIKRDHPGGGGKICKVLVRKKKNNNKEEKPKEEKQEETKDTFRCQFCHDKFESTTAFHVSFFKKF